MVPILEGCKEFVSSWSKSGSSEIKNAVVVIDYCCMVNGGGSCTGVHLNGKKRRRNITCIQQ